MSMISGLIDELNKSADEWNASNMFELAHMCRKAADTIWQLRDDLQRANAENVKLREERDHWHVEQVHAYGNWEDAHKRAIELEKQNAKLRKLAARMAEALGIDCEWADPNWCKSPCVLEFGCWPNDERAEIRCPAWAAMHDLGVEVEP